MKRILLILIIFFLWFSCSKKQEIIVTDSHVEMEWNENYLWDDFPIDSKPTFISLKFINGELVVVDNSSRDWSALIENAPSKLSTKINKED